MNWHAEGEGNRCAYGFNNAGQVVSKPQTSSGSLSHAFVCKAAQMVDLGTLEGGTESYAYDINDATPVQIVGWSNTYKDGQWDIHACLWERDDTLDPPWRIQDLGTLPGGSASRAYGINDEGVVVGSSYWGYPEIPDYSIHAFVWNADCGMEDLTVRVGGLADITSAIAINNLGDILVSVNGSPDLIIPPCAYGGCPCRSEMWETNNKTNRIPNATPKDDPIGKDKDNDPPFSRKEWDPDTGALWSVYRNKLYIVADTSNQYRVSLKVNVLPIVFRSDYLCAAYDSGEKIPGSDTPFPEDPEQPADMVFTDPNADAAVTDFDIRYGRDANHNGLLDDDEGYPLYVYTTLDTNEPRYAIIKGINFEKYEAYVKEIQKIVTLFGQNNGIVDTEGIFSLLSITRSFVSIFYRGGTADIVLPWRPTETTVQLDAFQSATASTSCFSEWLTHNAGVGFDQEGKADIKNYFWDYDTPMAKFFENVAPFAPEFVRPFYRTDTNSVVEYEFPTRTGKALEEFYNQHVKADAEALLASEPNGTEIIMPQGEEEGYYTFPTEGSSLFVSGSLMEVPGITVDVGDPGLLGQYANPLDKALVLFLSHQIDRDNYQAAISVGRGRVLDPRYQFTVRKNGTAYPVVNVRFECELQDLYDFSWETPSPAEDAAGVQLGYGNGNSGRSKGVIYRHRIALDANYPFPFERGIRR